MREGRHRQIPAWGLVAAGVTAVWQPALLAFPYHQRFGETVVHAERPIDATMAAVLGRAEALARTSPIYSGAADDIYLTDGGWRWRVAALGSWGAFALRRPFMRSFVVNRNDIAADRVTNNRAIGGVRTLSGVIAHETMHIAIADLLGEMRAGLVPGWKAEGYADHVAQESSLSGVQAAKLEASGQAHPALRYFHGRRRVAAALQRDGGDVKALLAD